MTNFKKGLTNAQAYAIIILELRKEGLKMKVDKRKNMLWF